MIIQKKIATLTGSSYWPKAFSMAGDMRKVAVTSVAAMRMNIKAPLVTITLARSVLLTARLLYLSVSVEMMIKTNLSPLCLVPLSESDWGIWNVTMLGLTDFGSVLSQSSSVSRGLRTMFGLTLDWEISPDKRPSSSASLASFLRAAAFSLESRNLFLSSHA